MIHSSFLLNAQIVIPLWQNSIPNSKKSNEKETQIVKEPGLVWVEKVQTPTIEVFLPSKGNANGQAVLICPGGGYEGLAYDWEGADIAKLLNSKGIAGIVLKSRLPNSKSIINRSIVPLQDAQRAMRLIRFHAKEWNIKKDKIGVIGFSAGGHLASTLGTHFKTKTIGKPGTVDLLSARPDFMLLIYPVISMDKSITHMGSRNALLGNKPSQSLINEYSNELQIKNNTPPTFIIHSADDDLVPVKNSIEFYLALLEKNISAEMHIFPFGGHGYSLAFGLGYLNTWPDILFNWLKNINTEN